MTTIAKNLRLLRLKADKKQNELAELLDISQQEYSKFERGSSTPNMKHSANLAKFYNVTIDQLLHADLSGHTHHNQTGSHSLTSKERELYEKLLEAKDAQIKILEAVSALKLPKD